MVLQFLALPFHMLMTKILAKDLRLTLPRHKIMFSLSLSDGLQVFIIFITALAMKVFSLKTDTNACIFLRQIALADSALTLPVSSLAVLAMSLERYVACIHSFRLHEMFSDTRVAVMSGFIWAIGAVCAVIAVAIHPINTQETIVGGLITFKMIAVIFVIPTSIAVAFIQARLFFFSRTKLSQITPSGAFGAQAELADFRKKQIKVALVASIIAFAFVLCMLPLAATSLYEIINNLSIESSFKTTCIAMAMANTLVDPFIYGIGVADTRRVIMKNLKNLKLYMLARNG